VGGKLICKRYMREDQLCYLSSYLDSLFMIKQFPEMDIEKGRMIIDPGAGFRRAPTTQNGQMKTKQRWRPPMEGQAKLNVDGAFAGLGRAGAGVVLRDHQGQVILSACRHLPNCRDADTCQTAEMLQKPSSVQLRMGSSSLCNETRSRLRWKLIVLKLLNY
jgi:hypothetical protein